MNMPREHGGFKTNSRHRPNFMTCIAKVPDADISDRIYAILSARLV